MFYCNFKCSLFIWLFRFWFQTSHGSSSMSYVLPNICFYIFLCLFVVLTFVFFAWTFLSLLTDFPCVLYITKINIHKKMSSFYVLKLHIFKLSNRIESITKCVQNVKINYVFYDFCRWKSWKGGKIQQLPLTNVHPFVLALTSILTSVRPFVPALISILTCVHPFVPAFILIFPHTHTHTHCKPIKTHKLD